MSRQIIRRENLELALHYAIQVRSEEEQRLNGGGWKSILVAGWEQVLAALRSNKDIEVIE